MHSLHYLVGERLIHFHLNRNNFAIYPLPYGRGSVTVLLPVLDLPIPLRVGAR